MTLTEAIREKLRDTGHSVRKIATVTELQRTTVSDFLAGRDVRGKSLDKLAEYLGGVISFPGPRSEPVKKR